MSEPTRILREAGAYRVVEYLDLDYDIENLKGDVYNPKHLREMHGEGATLESMREKEADFEAEVARAGVFGYVLERWNPEVGAGWEHVDSCWGFVGAHTDCENDRYHHYIVGELASQIPHQPGLFAERYGKAGEVGE